MIEFSTCYKDGINCLNIPDYSMEELRSFERHKKYAKRKKQKTVISVMLLIFILCIVVSTTTYAAYKLNKRMKFTTQGVKLDSVRSDEMQDDSLMHEYIDTSVSITDVIHDKLSEYKEAVYKDTNELCAEEHADIRYFDTWDDAQKDIDFPIIYPKSIQYSALKIIYQITTFSKYVEALYIADEKELTVKYTCFLSSNWDFAIDYNGDIIDKYLYTNKYYYDFWIVECQYDEGIQINAMTSINDYLIQLSFLGYEENEIFEILEEFNLSIY